MMRQAVQRENKLRARAASGESITIQLTILTRPVADSMESNLSELAKNKYY